MKTRSQLSSERHWRRKVTRGSITNCVLTNLVSEANKRAGKVGKILLVELVEGSGNSLLNYSTRSSNVVELIIFGIRATEWSTGRGLDQHYERTLCEAQIFYPTHPTLGYFVCFPFAFLGGLNGAKPSTFIYWLLFGGQVLCSQLGFHLIGDFGSHRDTVITRASKEKVFLRGV